MLHDILCNIFNSLLLQYVIYSYIFILGLFINAEALVQRGIILREFLLPIQIH